MTRSSAARRDLFRIWLFSAREWGLERADAYLADIDAVVARLAAFPASGPSQSYRGRHYRRAVAGRHLLIYRITPGEIEIVRVLHQQMNAASHLA